MNHRQLVARAVKWASAWKFAGKDGRTPDLVFAERQIVASPSVESPDVLAFFSERAPAAEHEMIGRLWEYKSRHPDWFSGASGYGESMRGYYDSVREKGPFTWRTALIEVKASRSDFLADRKKPFRTKGAGAGDLRYFFAPKGLIHPDELPEGWGLVEVYSTQSRLKVNSERHPKSDLVREAEIDLLIRRFRAALEFDNRDGVTAPEALSEAQL